MGMHPKPAERLETKEDLENFIREAEEELDRLEKEQDARLEAVEAENARLDQKATNLLTKRDLLEVGRTIIAATMVLVLLACFAAWIIQTV